MDNDYVKHSIEGIRTSNSDNDSNAKVCGKRKRIPGTPSRRHQRSEEVPWTAARCNRLLRTITSRIQILRRLSENNFADKAAARQSPARRKIIFRPGSNEGGRVSPEGVEDVRSQLAALPALESPTKDGNDPDWLPDEGRKPSQRTYGGKQNKSRKIKIEEASRPARNPSNADFRSPFIKRILRTEAANSPVNHVTETPRRLTSQKIVLDPKTHAERALRTLLDSFSTVLSITAPEPPSCRMGAGSLRNMCLRKVPDYIDYEQQDAYDDEEYDFDATESIYLHLEERLGTGSRNGLRTVVRAHAVKMIADAMDERSWPVESLDRLLDVCERNQAVEEGQQILSSWFVRAEEQQLNRVVKVLAWSKILDCTGFFFKTLRDMLESGRGRLSEIVECPGIWQDLLKTLARKSTRTDAAEFLEVYMRTCLHSDERESKGSESMRLHQRLKRDETLHNVMVLVTALCWTIEETSSASTNATTSLTSYVHRMAINICQDQRIQASRNLLRSVEPLFTSSIVLHAIRATGDSDSAPLLSADIISQTIAADCFIIMQCFHQPGANSSRAEFVCSTAKCIAHASQSSAIGFIYDLSSSLLLLATRVPEQYATSLKQFAANTAATWAEYRADKSSYVFADEVERAAFCASPGKQLTHTPVSAQRPKVFRFEEAIGEWIATTPLASGKLDAEPQRESIEKDDSGHALNIEADPPCADLDRANFGHLEINQINPQAVRENGGAELASVPEHLFSPLSQAVSSFGIEVHDDRQCTESGLIVEEQFTLSGILSKSPTASSLRQDLESPLQAKIFRSIPGQLQREEKLERDELAATPYKNEPVGGSVPMLAPFQNEVASTMPAPAFEESQAQTTLALRPRRLPTQSTEDGTLFERDELAATPAQQLSRSSDPERPLPALRSTSEHRDGVNMTPVKQPTPPTRVLRSAKQKTAPPVQGYDVLQTCDELAMTPAQRVRASPRKTKVAKQNVSEFVLFTECSEHDELGATPRYARTLRSRPKQTSKAKGSSGLRTAKLSAKKQSQSPFDSTGKQTKQPLGVRPANITTVARNGTKAASDDELGF